MRERFFEISTSAYETLDAPRVGFAAVADEWARERYRDNPSAAATEEEFVTRLQGFFVVDLVSPCDGIPPYSNGRTGGQVEPFSFRAQFLIDCKDVIGDALLEEAYKGKFATSALRRRFAALLHDLPFHPNEMLKEQGANALRGRADCGPAGALRPSTCMADGTGSSRV